MGEFGSEVTAGGNNIVVKYNDNSTSNPLNYKIVMEYRVTPAELTLKPADVTKTYDGTTFKGIENISGAGFTATGFRLNDAANPNAVYTMDTLRFGTLASPTDASGTPVKNAEGAIHAGTYGIGIAGSSVTLHNNDYTIKYADGTLTVNKRAITVKPDDVTHVYGDLPNSLSGGLAAGSTLAAGDTLTGLVVQNNGQRDVQRDASGNVTAQTGVLTATGAHVKNAATGEDVSNDYVITSGTANLTITPRTVYIDAGRNARTASRTPRRSIAVARSTPCVRRMRRRASSTAIRSQA